MKGKARKAESGKQKKASPLLYAVPGLLLAIAAALLSSVYQSGGSTSPPAGATSVPPPQPSQPPPQPPQTPEESNLHDNHTECKMWAAAGECSKNSAFMLMECKRSCSVSAADPDALPAGWSEYKDPASGKPYYSDGSRTQWDRPTAVAGSPSLADALPAGWSEYTDPKSGNKYYSDGVKTQWERPEGAAAARTGGVQDTWKSASECIAWAGAGECENNAAFMSQSCAGACSKVAASRADYARRCPRPSDAQPALEANTMNATFERIMREFGALSPEMVSHDPPIVLFHSFISPEEADAFIAHGKGKYTESRGVGVDENGKMTDVKTEIRTSSHTWCQESACLNDPHVQRVVARVSDVSQTPSANGEFAQLVYYRACPEEGHPSCAFYRRHSDYIEGDRYRVQGVRIYTLFMYLNDVEEGGGTRFTDLPGGPVTFMPSRGKAVLWPSVLDSSPDVVDPRTHHEALPVTKGEKFGANFWIHMHDFKAPHSMGCTM